MNPIVEKTFWGIVLFTVLGAALAFALAFVRPPVKPMDPAKQAYMLEQVEKISADATARITALEKIKRSEKKIEKAKGARP